MSLAISTASLPVFRRMLAHLRHIVQMGIDHAQGHGLTPQQLLQARLAPDMLPFSRQVTVACDVVKIWGHRIQGLEPPRSANEETSLVQLQQRIDQTLDWLACLPVEMVDASEQREINMPAGNGQQRTMRGQDYLLHWALPNFYFHVSMAYAILRHLGVPLGKQDYLYGPNSA